MFSLFKPITPSYLFCGISDPEYDCPKKDERPDNLESEKEKSSTQNLEKRSFSYDKKQAEDGLNYWKTRKYCCITALATTTLLSLLSVASFLEKTPQLNRLLIKKSPKTISGSCAIITLAFSLLFSYRLSNASKRYNIFLNPPESIPNTFEKYEKGSKLTDIELDTLSTYVDNESTIYSSLYKIKNEILVEIEKENSFPYFELLPKSSEKITEDENSHISKIEQSSNEIIKFINSTFDKISLSIKNTRVIIEKLKEQQRNSKNKKIEVISNNIEVISNQIDLALAKITQTRFYYETKKDDVCSTSFQKSTLNSSKTPIEQNNAWEGQRNLYRRSIANINISECEAHRETLIKLYKILKENLPESQSSTTAS